MTITIEQLTRGYLVTLHRDDGSGEAYAELVKQSAVHRVATLLGIEPARLYAPEIALADGQPATGGGESSQTLLDAGEFVELAPEAAALIEMADEDAPVAGLKAGEAYREEEE